MNMLKSEQIRHFPSKFRSFSTERYTARVRIKPTTDITETERKLIKAYRNNRFVQVLLRWAIPGITFL